MFKAVNETRNVDAASELDCTFGPLPVPLFIVQEMNSRWEEIYKMLFAGNDVTVQVGWAETYLSEMQAKFDRGFFDNSFDWKEALRRAKAVQALGSSAVANEMARRQRAWETVASNARTLLEDGFALNKSGRDFILASHGAFAFALLSALSASNSLYKFGPMHVGLCLCGIGLLLLIPGTVLLIRVNLEAGTFLRDQFEDQPKWLRFDRERKVFFGRKRGVLNWINTFIYGSLGVLAFNIILLSAWLVALSVPPLIN